MTENQLSKMATKIAKKYAASESVKRSDVVRDVVRTHKLSLEESLILADCIVKGLYEAGKALVVA